MTDPFNVSSTPCTWQLCTRGCDMNYLRNGVPLCREHALLVWSVTDEQLRTSKLTTQQIEEQVQIEDQERDELDQRRRARKSAAGAIYYIRVGPHIKIGFTCDIRRRLLTYPPDTELLALNTGTLDDETNLHRRFADLRVAGREWYHPHHRLMSHISEVSRNRRHYELAADEWKRRGAPPMLHPLDKPENEVS